MTEAQKAIDYAHAHHEPYMAGFLELLRIPSVSTDPSYKAELERCADWIWPRVRKSNLPPSSCRRTANHMR